MLSTLRKVRLLLWPNANRTAPTNILGRLVCPAYLSHTTTAGHSSLGRRLGHAKLDSLYPREQTRVESPLLPHTSSSVVLYLYV